MAITDGKKEVGQKVAHLFNREDSTCYYDVGRISKVCKKHLWVKYSDGNDYSHACKDMDYFDAWFFCGYTKVGSLVGREIESQVDSGDESDSTNPEDEVLGYV